MSATFGSLEIRWNHQRIVSRQSLKQIQAYEKQLCKENRQQNKVMTRVKGGCCGEGGKKMETGELNTGNSCSNTSKKS